MELVVFFVLIYFVEYNYYIIINKVKSEIKKKLRFLLENIVIFLSVCGNDLIKKIL